MRLLEADEIELYARQRDLLRKSTRDTSALLRVAIYARKSTKDKTATSIPSQISECQKFVSRYKDLFSQEFNHIYIDEDISGLTYNRKGLQKMLDAAERKEFDVLAVYHNDRLTRDVGHFKQIDKVLRKYHIEELFCNIHCRRDAMGQYLMRLFYSNAELEVDTSAERTATVLRNKAQAGTSAGGSAPYGFKYAGKQFAINEDEAPAIRLMFRLAADGESYSTIRNELTQRGYKTRAGREFANSTISDILRNRKYKGEYVYCIHGADGHQKNIKHDRVIEYEQDEIINNTAVLKKIVSPKQFDEVQRILDSHTCGTPKQDAHSEYTLSGLIQCKCGANVCGETTSKRGKSYRYYVCQGQRKKQGCSVKKIRAEFLENTIRQVVIRECKSLLASGSIKQESFEVSEKNLKTEIKNLSRVITNLDRDNEELINQLVGASKSVSDAIKQKLEDNIEANKTNKKRLEHLKEQQAKVQNLHGNTATENIDFDKLFADNKRARRMIKLFVKRIVLDDDNITIEVY